MDSLIKTLTDRHLFDDATSPELDNYLNAESRIVYAGFDPTSKSLQIGNFVTIMALRHYQLRGHRPLAIVGGATGMIGDPSGKSSERQLLTREAVAENLVGIKENLSRFLDFEDKKAPALLLNNADWFDGLSYTDFLRDVGKHFRMGSMLGKESVKARLASEGGMSYTEFSYQLLQGYDFLVLNDRHNCTVQLGGSDQWGNMTAGIDLIHKLRGKDTFAMTFPLVCDSSGKKFGKSEGNAVYLDASLTSFYDFYQYFLRVEDADVVRLLKIFTFLSMQDILDLEQSLRTEPEKRLPQRRLAEEVTKLVHGASGLSVAEKATQVLFGGSIDGMRASDLIKVLGDVKSATMTRSDIINLPVLDLAVKTGFCTSKGEARRLVENGGFNVNNIKVTEIGRTVTDADIIDGAVVMLRSGKRNYFLVHVQ